MVKKPELDFQVEPERQLLEHAELWLEFALEAKEPISHSSRPQTLGTSIKEKERTGQELEVLQWIQLNIHMEEVTNNILVILQPLEEILQEVAKSVLLPLEELVSSEEVEKLSKKKSDLFAQISRNF